MLSALVICTTAAAAEPSLALGGALYEDPTEEGPAEKDPAEEDAANSDDASIAHSSAAENILTGRVDFMVAILRGPAE